MSRRNENGYDSDRAINEWSARAALLLPRDMWRVRDGEYTHTDTRTHASRAHNLSLSKTVGCNRAKTITKLYLPDLIPSFGLEVITFKLQI